MALSLQSTTGVRCRGLIRERQRYSASRQGGSRLVISSRLLQGHRRALQCLAAVAADSLPATSVQLLEAQQHPTLQGMAQKVEQLQIMYDTLVVLHEKIARAEGLQPTPTKVSNTGLSTYGTPDGATHIALQVNKGGRVAWMSSVCSALSMLQSGIMRLNAFPDESTRVPKLDIEVFYGFDAVTMYINPCARTNLLLDAAYFSKYYKTPTSAGYSMNDLELQLQEDPAFQPFRSKSADIRMLTGQSALLYQAQGSVENVRKCTEYAKKMVDMWLEWLAQGEEPDAAQLEELKRHDAALYPFARKDPGNAQIVALIGEAQVEEILALTCMEPSILK